MTDREFNDRMEALARRHEAMAINLELFGRDLDGLRGVVERLVTMSENLLSVAQNHERRINHLEGQ